MKFYTGVGSRKTPKEILEVMTLLASVLESKSFILRTGEARGADDAFLKGVKDKEYLEIYYKEDATKESMKLAGSLHPNWGACTDYAKKLHGRNCFQIMGKDLKNPIFSKFLICWTPDGIVSNKYRSRLTGGTGTTISLAEKFNIKVYNLKRPSHYDKIMRFLDKNLKKT